MANEGDSSQIRKTVSLTHRQIGATGLVALAVGLAPYLKESFVTKQDGAMVAAQVEYLRKDVADLKEVVVAQGKNVIEAVDKSEKRTVKNEDRLERRIENLEIALNHRH